MPKETEAKGIRMRAVRDGLSPAQDYSNKASSQNNKTKCLSPRQGDNNVNNSPNKVEMPILASIPESKTLSQENMTVNKSENDLKETNCKGEESLHININQLKVKAVKVPK